MKLVGLLVRPEFPLLSFSSVVTPLQEANRLSGQRLYSVSVLSLDGLPVASADQISVSCTRSIRQADEYDIALICTGYDPKAYGGRAVQSWLRHQLVNGAELGAISTGTYILAMAGLLKNRRCTIHWENAASFAEDFPETELTNSLFEVDGAFWTCSGGTSAMDMMLNLIARDHGRELAIAVSHQFQHDRIRTSTDDQDSLSFFSQQINSPTVVRAMQFIHSNGAANVTPRKVADAVGLSQRQLDRLFHRYLEQSPIQFLIEMRLRHARELLLTTNMGIIDIVVATGFGSRSNFYRAYKNCFGRAPKQERDVPQGYFKGSRARTVAHVP